MRGLITTPDGVSGETGDGGLAPALRFRRNAVLGENAGSAKKTRRSRRRAESADASGSEPDSVVSAVASVAAASGRRVSFVSPTSGSRRTRDRAPGRSRPGSPSPSPTPFPSPPREFRTEPFVYSRYALRRFSSRRARARRRSVRALSSVSFGVVLFLETRPRTPPSRAETPPPRR